MWRKIVSEIGKKIIQDTFVKYIWIAGSLFIIHSEH